MIYINIFRNYLDDPRYLDAKFIMGPVVRDAKVLRNHKVFILDTLYHSTVPVYLCTTEVKKSKLKHKLNKCCFELYVKELEMPKSRENKSKNIINFITFYNVKPLILVKIRKNTKCLIFNNYANKQ